MLIMRKLLKIITRLLLAIIVIFLLYILGILLINTVYDYQPVGGNYELEAFRNYPPVQAGRTYSAVTWNIGYGGLGRESDFFYDGGSMSSPDKETFKRYCRGIDNSLASFDSIDLILLQEVDISSRRSYDLNQSEIVKSGGLMSDMP